MAESYPYVLNNGKISSLFEAIENAAKPSKFTHEFLKKIGFPSSNDRAFVSLFRHLGLIGVDNAPTEIFDDVRDPQKRSFALGRAIQDSYADLFAINRNIHKASDADIKATISRVTGRDAEYVNRAYGTFKSLLALSRFDSPPLDVSVTDAAVPPPGSSHSESDAPPASVPLSPSVRSGVMSLNYNIQIHLPATTDISVYNAIFRSLRDTLGVS
jgi:Family of unknown function (DUF5343)